MNSCLRIISKSTNLSFLLVGTETRRFFSAGFLALGLALVCLAFALDFFLTPDLTGFFLIFLTKA